MWSIKSLVALILTTGMALHSANATDLLTVGEHYAPVKDVRIWYRVAGRGPVLLVQPPGWGIGSAYLQRSLAPLERSFTVIYFDARGSGKSSRPIEATQMSTLDMAADLESLREYLGLQTVAVLGHSDGGEIAAAFAANNPTRINHLVLVDALPPRNPDPDRHKIKEIYDQLAKDPRYSDAIKAMREPGQAAGDILKRTTPLFWHDVSKASALGNLPQPDEWAYSAWTKARKIFTFDLLAKLNQLSTPVLIVQGRYDYEVPVFEQDAFVTNIPKARLVVFEVSGHFPWIEEPERFFPMVSDFLGR